MDNGGIGKWKWKRDVIGNWKLERKWKLIMEVEMEMKRNQIEIQAKMEKVMKNQNGKIGKIMETLTELKDEKSR